MKYERELRMALAVFVIFLFANVLNLTISTSRFTESYPEVTCPPNLSGLATSISLSDSHNGVRKTGTSSMKTRRANTYRYAISGEAAILSSEKVTPVVWQVRTGTWAGAAPCATPITNQWFVGGTAGITSKGSLNLVNSGLGRSLIDVTVYDENGAQTPQSFSIPANTSKSISLSTLTPGSKSIAIHVQPRSGRVNAFLYDERGKGLRALGGDIVNSTIAPTKLLSIPAIPQKKSKKQIVGHTLRLLVPGQVDARITAEIRSSDGTFAPVGVDGVKVGHQKVVTIPLDINLPAGNFALVIKSDQPILGSVYSNTTAKGKNDFIWSTAAEPLKPFSLAVTGLSPKLVFTGRAIDIKLSLTSTSGKSRNIRVQGSDIASFQVPDQTRLISFRKVSANTSGAALIAAKSGFGYLPLVAGSQLTKSSIPASNIRVLNP